MPTTEAATGGIALTPKGEAYALAQLHSREEIEAHIEDLISMLDAIDSDPDLEPDNDLEPSIGGSASWGQEVDIEADDADNEPSLASPESSYALAAIYWPPTGQLYSPAVPLSSQESWSSGGCNDDREDEHDGTEPENEHGTDLDAGEDDGLWMGEHDEAESDGGGHIPGSGYHV